jgi:hypothetical protein
MLFACCLHAVCMLFACCLGVAETATASAERDGHPETGGFRTAKHTRHTKTGVRFRGPRTLTRRSSVSSAPSAVKRLSVSFFALPWIKPSAGFSLVSCIPRWIVLSALIRGAPLFRGMLTNCQQTGGRIAGPPANRAQAGGGYCMPLTGSFFRGFAQSCPPSKAARQPPELSAARPSSVALISSSSEPGAKGLLWTSYPPSL